MKPADAAMAVYRERWEALRHEADDTEHAAATAPGPITAAKLRGQAKRARDYAELAHRARYAELLDPEPVAR